MRQFDLEEFKKNPNRKVVTRSGRQVRILCTDAKGDCPVFGLALGVDGCEFPIMCSAIGETEFEEDDLFFDVEKKEGYINLYHSKLGIGLCQCSLFVISKDDAEKEAAKYPDDFIATAHVEWEE